MSEQNTPPCAFDLGRAYAAKKEWRDGFDKGILTAFCVWTLGLVVILVLRWGTYTRAPSFESLFVITSLLVGALVCLGAVVFTAVTWVRRLCARK